MSNVKCDLKISVIIPVRPGGPILALDALRVADYPPELLEIIAVEGDCPSRQRNQAARKAEGDVLYFLDDDSAVAPDVFRRLAQHYADPGVHAVGGPSLTPDDEPLLSRCIGYALGTCLGAWSMRARWVSVGEYRPAGEKELIGCNLSVRRQTLEVIGGFHEELFPNEETELVSRLARSGHLAMYDPGLIVRRAQRRTLIDLASQFFRYGRGRMKQMRRAGRDGMVPFLAPALGLVYLALLPLLGWLLGPWAALPLAVYLAVIATAGVWLGLAHRTATGCIILPLVFGLIHTSYGYGLIVEGMVGCSRQPSNLLCDPAQAVACAGQVLPWKNLSTQEVKGGGTNP